MPMQIYTRLLSVIAFCVSGCWFTQEISLCVSVDDIDKDRTDMWDKWWPNCHWGLSSGQQIGHSRVLNPVSAAYCCSAWKPCEQL